MKDISLFLFSTRDLRVQDNDGLYKLIKHNEAERFQDIEMGMRNAPLMHILPIVILKEGETRDLFILQCIADLNEDLGGHLLYFGEKMWEDILNIVSKSCGSAYQIRAMGWNSSNGSEIDCSGDITAWCRKRNIDMVVGKGKMDSYREKWHNAEGGPLLSSSPGSDREITNSKTAGEMFVKQCLISPVEPQRYIKLTRLAIHSHEKHIGIKMPPIYTKKPPMSERELREHASTIGGRKRGLEMVMEGSHSYADVKKYLYYGCLSPEEILWIWKQRYKAKWRDHPDVAQFLQEYYSW